jgi:hypothetical protein
LEKNFKTFFSSSALMAAINGDPLRGFGGSSWLARLIVSVEADSKTHDLKRKEAADNNKETRNLHRAREPEHHD